MNDQFFFSPEDDCLAPLLTAVNNAKVSILIADYSFNIPQLTDLLIYKHQALVNVRMVLDKSQSIGKREAIELAKIRASGIDYVIGTSDRHQIMHLKVAVIDNDTTIFGSYNFTTNVASQDNVLAVFVDPDLAKDFTTHIQSIYQWIQTNEPLGLERITMDYKDIAVRAVKTFGQAFVASLLASAINFSAITSVSDGKKLLLSALVAAVSVVWNVVLVPAFKPVTVKLGL